MPKSSVTMEGLESRTLLAAVFSLNSVKRLYNEVIGGAASGSRVVRYKNVSTKSQTIPSGGVVISGANASEYKIISGYTLPRGLKPGAIILLHDGNIPVERLIPTVKGLLAVLQKSGYDVVRLDELLK